MEPGRKLWSPQSPRYDAGARITRHVRHIDGKAFITQFDYDALGRLSKKTLADGTRLRYRYNGPLHAKPGVLAGIDRDGLIDTPIVANLNQAEERFDQRGFSYGNTLKHTRGLDQDGQLRNVGNAQVGQSRLTLSNSGIVQAAYHASTMAGQQAREEGKTSWRTRAGFYLGGLGAQAPPAAHSTDFLGIQRPRYDLRGQLLEDATYTFRWDGLGRLTEVYRTQAPKQLIARYRYNLFGERIAKEVYTPNGKQTTYFLYDGAELAAEADSQGRLIRQYVHLEGRPVALLAGRATYFIHSDHRLSPVALTDAKRKVVWQAKIADNGAARVAKESAVELPLRASNQYFDAETGLHYNIHRYLDPHSGRYLSPDPEGLAAGPDLYQFALGEPHRYVDVLGLNPIKTDADVPKASFGDKLQYTFEKAAQKLPGAVGNALLELVSPENIAGTVAIFVLWGASHALGFGFIADIAMVGMAYYALGSAAIDFVKGILDLVNQTNSASCIKHLDAAANVLLSTTNVLIQAAGGKGKQGDEAIKAVFGGGKSKLPNPPPPGAKPPPGKQLVLHPTSIKEVANQMTTDALKAGKLTQVSPGVYKSSAGLVYGVVKGTNQPRIEHVAEHLTLGFKKDKNGDYLKDKNGNLIPKENHSVFAIAPDKLLGTLDEAWSKRGAPTSPISQGKRTVYEVEMGRPIGVNGETKIRM